MANFREFLEKNTIFNEHPVALTNKYCYWILQEKFYKFYILFCILPGGRGAEHPGVRRVPPQRRRRRRSLPHVRGLRGGSKILAMSSDSDLVRLQRRDGVRKEVGYKDPLHLTSRRVSKCFEENGLKEWLIKMMRLVNVEMKWA